MDKSLCRQNHFMPGVRIPIYTLERFFETKPDYLLILPWNLKKEISEQMAGVRAWSGNPWFPFPKLKSFE